MWLRKEEVEKSNVIFALSSPESTLIFEASQKCMPNPFLAQHHRSTLVTRISTIS